jgi:hypothetical protein
MGAGQCNYLIQLENPGTRVDVMMILMMIVVMMMVPLVMVLPETETVVNEVKWFVPIVMVDLEVN